MLEVQLDLRQVESYLPMVLVQDMVAVADELLLTVHPLRLQKVTLQLRQIII